LIPIKKSHIRFCNSFQLYYISENEEPVLYKKAGDPLRKEAFKNNQYSRLFIRKKDEEAVAKTMQTALNIELARAVSSKGILAIKRSLCTIVEEALSGPLETSLSALPETLEILFYGIKRKSDLLNALVAINNKSPKTIEHSVNVMAIAAQYCFFKDYSEEKLKTFCLAALLHDIGTCKVDKKIIESRERLTDKEYSAYKKHTVKGCDILKSYPSFDKSVSITALEHHERLDGSGYPHGVEQISFEGQAIGLIDSYEALKYQEKTFRQALKPYDALQIIKKDVVLEKYNKKIFMNLCSCLIK
jgi:putative nucleotidyltransferase with HDIG domain